MNLKQEIKYWIRTLLIFSVLTLLFGAFLNGCKSCHSDNINNKPKPQNQKAIILVVIKNNYDGSNNKEIKRILKVGGKLFFGFPGKSFSKLGFDIGEVFKTLNIVYLKPQFFELIYYKSSDPFYIVGIAKK